MIVGIVHTLFAMGLGEWNSQKSSILGKQTSFCQFDIDLQYIDPQCAILGGFIARGQEEFQ